MRVFMAAFITTILWGLFLINPTFENERIVPKHKGVDPQLESYVNDYLDFASQKNIKFKHKVTVGFADINEKPTIGITWYGGYFREIDIDNDYWSRTTELSRTMLMYHELTHAYCDRDHDYGKDRPYHEHGGKPKDYPNGEGFFADDCPTSVMYPVILEDYCSMAHFNEYVDEMFDRCEPY